MTYILWSSDFVLYFEDCLMYEHYTLAIFHGPVILPHILKTDV